MGKIKVNNELLRIMDEYVSFVDSDKHVSMPMAITKEKPNHHSSLYAELPVSSDVLFGDVRMDCEIRNKDPHNYTFQLITDRFSQRVIVRLDEGNGTHRNNLPSIPLEQQEVTTPHFHRYDATGRFLAYHNEELKEHVGSILPIELGIELFCRETKIKPLEHQDISILINEDGVLPLEVDKDPLNGVVFS